MLIPTAVIAFLWLARLVVWTKRKLQCKKQQFRRSGETRELVRQADEIFALAELTDRKMVIHRGLPGYCIMIVHADFQAGLAERGKSAIGKPDFERIDRALEWWLPRETYMLAFSGTDLLSFHKGHLDLLEDGGDFMAVTHDVRHATATLKALNAYHSYLDLPSSLDEARMPRADAVSVPEQIALPPREPRGYDVTHANKIDHIVEYVEDGDPRTFDEMFYGNFDDEFIMLVDHRESDDDIIKMCERVLNTGELDVRVDDDTLDLIVDYRGIRHRIEYPDGWVSRDTAISGLNKIIQPEYELRYCTASDGSDTAAILPLKREEWHALEARCGETLYRYFEPIDEGFSKFRY